MKKVCLVAILIICITVLMPIRVYAEEVLDPSSLVADDSYNPSKEGIGEIPSDLLKFVGKILSALTAIGVIVTVVVLAVIGFTYIAGGSDDMAEMKSRLGGILIGAVLLTSATSIVRFVIYVM